MYNIHKDSKYNLCKITCIMCHAYVYLVRKLLVFLAVMLVVTKNHFEIFIF